MSTFANQILEYKDATIFAPTYFFEIGESVNYGNHKHATIQDKSSDSKIYQVQVEVSERDKTPYMRSDVLPWYSIFKVAKRESALTSQLDLRYRTLSSQVSGMLSRCESAGVDFNPSYQRGLVWTPEQKVALISTIFNKGSIGSLSFNQRDYSTAGPIYEVVDGKQRLTTLLEFSQNQFPFKGKLFCELSPKDRYHFENHNIMVYDLERGTEREILQLFLLVNRRGTPVDVKHIEMVEKKLSDLEENKGL